MRPLSTLRGYLAGENVGRGFDNSPNDATLRTYERAAELYASGLSAAISAPVLARVHACVRAGGGLAFTVKAGDGDGWPDDRLHSPRFFAYWSADALRSVIADSPRQLIKIREVAGTTAGWLHVLCRGT